MIQMIVGNKGKGKTKLLLDHVNTSIKEVSGNIVFLDKSNKNMYELNNKIRLINITEYEVANSSEFVGFIAGLISQDSDLQEIYIDSFLTLAYINEENLVAILNRLTSISEQNKIKIVLSISINESNVPEQFKDNIFIAL